MLEYITAIFHEHLKGCRETRCNTVHHYQVRGGKDPFLDASVFDTLGLDQKADVEASIPQMLNVSALNGLLIIEKGTLEELFRSHRDSFRTSFSSGPPARVRRLRVERTPYAKRVRGRLRHYSQDR